MSQPNNADAGSVSEGKGAYTYIQWKIPDFFKLADSVVEKKKIIAHECLSADCEWRFALNPITREKLGISLCCFAETAAKKTLACYIGPERQDKCKAIACGLLSTEPPGKHWVFETPFNLYGLKIRKSELVPSDILTITLCVIDNESDPPKKLAQRLMGLENLSSSFEDLFVSRKKADATVKVKSKDFLVHKLVLIARSSVFSAMFGHDTSEEQTGVVTVPDCDPDTFQDFLHYLYTGKFDRVTSSNSHHLYVTSDKYDVQPLKSFCVDHMKQNLTVENVLDAVALADRYEESELLTAAQAFFNRNFSKVISTSHWKTLMKEDLELANKLLQKMAPDINIKGN